MIRRRLSAFRSRWGRALVDRRSRPRSHSEPARQLPSRDSFVASPSPIEAELRGLFGRNDSLTIFDVGSCEGEDAIRYARLFPKARVFAVEPVPANLAILEGNLKRHGQQVSVTVLALAFSDHDGLASLHVSSGQPDDRPPATDWDYGNKSSSLLPPDRHLEVFPWIRFDQTIQVSTERLDHLCERLGIRVVDFIHLDVQGAELAVLRGAGRLLDQVRAVWMEVEAIPLYRGQPLKQDVQAFMAQHGFEIAKDTVGPVSGDQLYVATRIAGAGERP